MKALLVVDLQNDFSPSGALPVPEGDEIVSLINALTQSFELVIATQDWHPPQHQSFAEEHNKTPGEIIDLHGIDQVLWPVHCVQDTHGADFIPGFQLENVDWICQKGSDIEVDSYSGFFDNDHQKSTGLHAFLLEKGVNELVIAGLATDYCVKYTALDAVRLDYVTTVITDATRGVDLNPGDVKKSLEEMAASGVQLSTSDSFL